ncbi:MAG: MlaD family protein [Pseudomonadota bacterium]
MPDQLPDTPRATITNIEVKAVLLLVLMVLLLCGSVAYVMYARGVFERTQQLVLMSDDSEGVIVGMDLTFSGFAIGRVRRIELADDGKVRIVIDLASKDAKWVRTSSIFTMERGLVGDTKLKVFSGILSDPPLPPNSVRSVLRGDIAAEIPKLVGTVQALVENLANMTRADSSLNTALADVQGMTKNLQGRYGAMGAVLGGDENAKQVIQLLDRINTILRKADQRVFGAKGVMDDAQEVLGGAKGVMRGAEGTIEQLNGILAEARTSLQKVDAVLVDAQAIAGNARVATADLGALRSQVEQSLRKVEDLVNEINRKWPLARDRELKLP